MREGLISLAAVVMAFLALDDITTDNATAFPVERTALGVCGVWFVFVAFRLWQRRHRLFAVVSLAMVVGVGFAQPFIGPGTVPGYAAYLATIAGLLWFVGISLFLTWWGWKKGSRRV